MFKDNKIIFEYFTDIKIDNFCIELKKIYFNK